MPIEAKLLCDSYPLACEVAPEPLERETVAAYWRRRHVALKTCGDSLFTFLVSELSDQDLTLEEAHQRVDRAIDDLLAVSDAILAEIDTIDVEAEEVTADAATGA